MLKVRTTKTASGNTAVQVVYRHHQKTEIVKHIGTATDEKEQAQLVQLGYQFIATNNIVPPLLPEVFAKETQQNHLVAVENLSFTHTFHTFAHEFLSSIYALNGFTKLKNDLLRDLSIMRIIEPCSKLRSAELFNTYFGNTYTQNTLYKGLPAIKLLKEEAEEIAISYAKEHLGFNFSIVFYDVTTLYFETFKEDAENFKKPGFSKDNKPQQPQIVIGLVVNQDGYPIAIDMFPGNTFEGHTMIPVLRKLQKTHGIKTLTVIADAGMLSQSNIEEIEKAGLTYIVGARLGNMPTDKLRQISINLNKTEGVYYRGALPRGILICE